MDRPKLQSQVFLREDLEAILCAIVMANADRGDSPHDAAHRRGFAQAIVAIAVAIHVEPPPMMVQIITAPSNQGFHLTP